MTSAEGSLGTKSATGKSANMSLAATEVLSPSGQLSIVFAVKMLRQTFGAAAGSFILVPLQNIPSAAVSEPFGVFATHRGIAISACSFPWRLKNAKT